MSRSRQPLSAVLAVILARGIGVLSSTDAIGLDPDSGATVQTPRRGFETVITVVRLAASCATNARLSTRTPRGGVRIVVPGPASTTRGAAVVPRTAIVNAFSPEPTRKPRAPGTTAPAARARSPAAEGVTCGGAGVGSRNFVKSHPVGGLPPLTMS